MFAEAREKSSDQKLAAAYRQVNWIFSLSLPVSLDVVVKGSEAVIVWSKGSVTRCLGEF